jgi:adenylate cyclase
MASESEAERQTITIRWSLIRNLCALLVVLTGTILLTTFYTGQQISRSMSKALIERGVGQMESKLAAYVRPVEGGLRLTRSLARSGALDLEDTRELNRFFIPLIERIPQISSITLSDDQGRGYLLLRFPDRWRNRLTRSEEWGHRLEYAEWRDPETLIREWTVEDPPEEERYDPRVRDWYTVAYSGAEEHEPGVALPQEIYWTDPYTFFTTGEPGITASLHAKDADGERFVLAFDVQLRDLSEFTRKLKVSPGGLSIVMTEDRRVIGLPGLSRFARPDVRREALLKHPRDLGLQLLTDAADAAQARARKSGAPRIFPFESGGERHWADVRDVPLGVNRSIAIVVLVPESDLVGVITAHRLLLLGVSALGFAAAVVMALWLARRYSRPLARLAENSERMGSLELREFEPVESSLREVDQLATEQERMRVALDSFSRYVPVDVIKELMTRGEAARIGGARCEVTGLFTDIQGFTSIAETLSPEALTAHMAVYFEELLEIVQGDGYGTVTQLNGDGLVAFWGAPIQDDEHAAHCAAAVLRCEERLAELNSRWQGEGLPPLPTRFGLATGPVVVGNVGSVSRLVYTALGDTVNLASRLEGLSRFYGTRVLASSATREATGSAFAWRRVDRVRVKGKSLAVEVYELLGRTGQVPEERLHFARRYEEALDAYRSRLFGEAIFRLEALVAEHADDLSVTRLLELSRGFDAEPPPEDWDGASDFFEK